MRNYYALHSFELFPRGEKYDISGTISEENGRETSVVFGDSMNPQRIKSLGRVAKPIVIFTVLHKHLDEKLFNVNKM